MQINNDEARILPVVVPPFPTQLVADLAERPPYLHRVAQWRHPVGKWSQEGVDLLQAASAELQGVLGGGKHEPRTLALPEPSPKVAPEPAVTDEINHVWLEFIQILLDS